MTSKIQDSKIDEKNSSITLDSIPQNLKGPHKEKKVIYIDSLGVDWNNPANTVQNLIDSGFNIINFAFFLDNGPCDFALTWATLPLPTQVQLVTLAHSKNVIFMVSAGGATSILYPNQDPETYATLVSNWCITNNLDGVDYDIENLAPDFQDNFYTWFSVLLQTTRKILGPQRYISSAPQQPYMCLPNTPSSWPGAQGGFYKIVLDNANALDFLNCQFYNQGNNYTTYETCFLDSGVNFPQSAVTQIHNEGKGIPLYKIIFGSYLLPSDGNGGISGPDLLQSVLQRAHTELKWAKSVMVWQYHDLASAQAWIQKIYA